MILSMCRILTLFVLSPRQWHGYAAQKDWEVLRKMREAHFAQHFPIKARAAGASAVVRRSRLLLALDFQRIHEICSQQVIGF